MVVIALCWLDGHRPSPNLSFDALEFAPSWRGRLAHDPDDWHLVGHSPQRRFRLTRSLSADAWAVVFDRIYNSLAARPVRALSQLPLVNSHPHLAGAASCRALKQGALRCLLLVVAMLAAFSFERIASLHSASTAWFDASEKVDKTAPANAVGRWRPLLNLGAEYQDQGNYNEALRLFSQAEALGEPLGSARFNMGVSLQQLKQHSQALDNFLQAEAKGFTESALYYQRGESHYALGRFKEAFDSFTLALQKPQAVEAEQFTRLRLAESAVATQNYESAITSYQALVREDPLRQRYQVGLSMALVGKKDYAGAMAILNPAIAERPTGPAYYARALTYFYQGNRAASAKDLELALRAEPNNPIYNNLQQQLSLPTAKTAEKTSPNNSMTLTKP